MRPLESIVQRVPLDRWLRLGRRELGALLLAIAVAVSAVLVFGEVADDVQEGDTGDIDRAVLLALRDADDPARAIGPEWLVEAGRDITALGSMSVLALVVALTVGYLALTARRRAALLVLIASLGGTGLSTLLKAVFDRARPDLVPHGMQTFTSSFPSGHATLSAIVYLTLGAMLMRVHRGRSVKLFLLSSALLLTLLVGVSRVYLGVHWPTDVLAGWCVGAAWATLFWAIELWLQSRGAVEGETAAGGE